MEYKLPKIQSIPLNREKMDEQTFAAQYENPTEMLTCWFECKAHIKETIMNRFSDALVLQSLENARSIWPQSKVLQEDITHFRVQFTDPAKTPAEKIEFREEIAEYFYSLFLEFIISEQEALPYELSLGDLQKITHHCLKLLISPTGTMFEHSLDDPYDEYEEDEKLYEQDSVEKMAEIVRATISRRLLN